MTTEIQILEGITDGDILNWLEDDLIISEADKLEEEKRILKKVKMIEMKMRKKK